MRRHQASILENTAIKINPRWICSSVLILLVLIIKYNWSLDSCLWLEINLILEFDVQLNVMAMRPTDSFTVGPGNENVLLSLPFLNSANLFRTSSFEALKKRKMTSPLSGTQYSDLFRKGYE